MQTGGEMVTEEELGADITRDNQPKDFYCLYHIKMEQYVAIDGVGIFSIRDLGEKTLLVPDITEEILTDVASMLERIGISIDDILVVPTDHVLRTDFTQAVKANRW